MPNERDCPDSARWEGLLGGSPTAEEQAELVRHLEQCADCRRKLDGLAGPGLVLPQDGLAGPPGSATAPGLAEAIERLKAESPERTQARPGSSTVPAVRGLLGPSEDPRHLGRLAGYEIVKEIGRGGMGIVYKARDGKLERLVAIKVLNSDLASSGGARRRFLQEARAAAAVIHEHVVTIHAVEEANGAPFLVMEYIVGVSLEDRLQRTGHLRVEEVLRIGMQAAKGLEAAHAQGLVHRDIKPANILLENGVERVKITDFGLARALHEAQATQSGVVAGTPAYMSPEQARGEAVDPRSDLFSLGCVLYAMCTGRSPFRAESVTAAIHRVCEDIPRPIREINPEIPDWLEQIINRLLAKNPAERFQTAGEVAGLLGQHLAHLQRPSQIPPPPIPPAPSGVLPAHGRARRRVMWMLAGAALLATLGSAMGYLLWPRPTWVQLFNGKDLRGWKNHPDQPGGWSVVNGSLIGHGVVSHLFSERDDFADFHLRAEVKINDVGNSGIYSRSGYWLPNKQGSMGFPDGYETQICMVAAPLTGALYGLTSCNDRLTAPDEWFTLEIIVVGNHIRTKVNGVEAANYREKRAGSSTKGHLALQVATPETIVQFRKIEIRPLASDPPDDTSPSQVEVFATLVLDSDQTRVTIPGAAPVETWQGNGRYYPRLVRGNEYTIEVVGVDTGRLIRRERFTVTPGRSVEFTVPRPTEGASPEPERACKQELLHDMPVWYLAFSPKGDTLAVAEGSYAEDWRPEAVILWKKGDAGWQRAGRLEGHRHTVRGVAFHPHENVLASIGWDGPGAVIVWDLATGKQLRRLGTVKTFGESVDFSPDGNTLLATYINGNVELLDWRNGTSEAILQAHNMTKHRHAAAMSPVDRLFVIGGADGWVRLWDLDTQRKLCDLAGHTGEMGAVAFSPNGKKFASAGEGAEVIVWDVDSRKPIATFDNMSGAHGLAFSPDGRILATAGYDQTVKFWKVTGGSRNPIGHFFAHWSGVECLAFSPDGKTLATGSLGARNVRLWDVSDIMVTVAKSVE